MLQIQLPTEEEIVLLEEHYRKCNTRLIRERAHTILLGSDGSNAPQIARILRRPQNTIRLWIKEWNQARASSLFPRYTDNKNASKLTKEQQEEIKKTLESPPNEQGIPSSFWSVAALKSYLSAKYGVIYESDRSYHHLFEIFHFSYKLPEAFDKRRNDTGVEERMAEIHKELSQYSSPEWECFAADESSIVWETELKRAWLKKNQKTIIKADRIKQRQNYFGALNLKSGKHTLVPLSWQNTKTIIEALRTLSAAYPSKKMCIIWDNAKWHRAKVLRDLLGPEKEFSHIRFVWLPPYAPDRNPEEHVWKFGKEAISNRLYSSFKELTQTFENALSNQFFHYKFS